MDNYFQNCPPRMADQGRHLGDFKTATRRNELIKYYNNLWRDDQYRLFLQKNAKIILDREWNYHRKRNSCWNNDCIHNYPYRVTPRQLWQEMEAYNSIGDVDTNKKLAHMRQCSQYVDYRMNPHR